MSLADPKTDTEIISRLLMPRCVHALIGDRIIVLDPDYAPFSLVLMGDGDSTENDKWVAELIKFEPAPPLVIPKELER